MPAQVAAPLVIDHVERRRVDIARVENGLFGRVFELARGLEPFVVILFRKRRLVYERLVDLRFGLSLRTGDVFELAPVRLEPRRPPLAGWGSTLSSSGSDGSVID